MEIHPRSFGDSLGDLIAMLGRVWRPLLMPALISSVAVALASYAVLAQTGALDVIDLTVNDPELFDTLDDDVLLELLFDVTTGIVGVAVVSVVLYGFLYLVAARAVGNELSDPPARSSVTAAGFRLLLPWLVTGFLISIALLVGLLLLIVPAVWIGISASMATPVIAIEEAGPVTAIRRSFTLVKGNWWETLGFLVLVGLIGGTATQFIQVFAVPLFLVGSPSVAFGLTIALALAAQGLIMAAIAVATTMWYLNLRARADGPYVLQVS